MKRSLIVGLAMVAATLIPWTASATATGGGSATDEIDIVYAAMDGSGEFNVWGTLRCDAAGPLNLDLQFSQESTGGVGSGASNLQTCLAPGQTIRWVMDAFGGPLMVDDQVAITAFSFGSTTATTSEVVTLHWGLPSAG